MAESHGGRSQCSRRPSWGGMASAPWSDQSRVVQGICRVHLFITSTGWRPSFWDAPAALICAGWTVTGMHGPPQTPGTPSSFFLLLQAQAAWTRCWFCVRTFPAEVKPWPEPTDKSRRTTAPSTSSPSYICSPALWLGGSPEGLSPSLCHLSWAAVVPAGAWSSERSSRLQRGRCWASQLSQPVPATEALTWTA